jgi:MYXO-CTERM domain-containing protein
MGSWASPKNLSTHGVQNVVFKDGIAVLALTSDDATGFTGNPPPDDGSVWKDPVTGGPPPGGGGGGCGCRLTADRAEPSGIVALLAWAALVWVRRRRVCAS